MNSSTTPFETNLDDGVLMLEKEGSGAHIVYLVLALFAALALILIVCLVPKNTSHDRTDLPQETSIILEDEITRNEQTESSGESKSCFRRWYYRCIPGLLLWIVGFSILSGYSRLESLNDHLDYFGPMTVHNISLATGQRGLAWYTLADLKLEWNQNAMDEVRVCNGTMTVCEHLACTLNGSLTEICSDEDYIDSFARVETCLVDEGFRNIQSENEEPASLTISAHGSCEDGVAAILTKQNSRRGVRVGFCIALVGAVLLFLEICISCGFALALCDCWTAIAPRFSREDSAFVDPVETPSLKVAA